MFADHVPDATAEAVALLERAGYATVGKANLHEFAWGITSENPHYGWVPNPLAPRPDRGRVERRVRRGARGRASPTPPLGTDSAGSIRIPAACCGITGFKPTYGLVPIDGCFPLAPSFDHAGPMARDVAGCARMMEALAPGLEARRRSTRSPTCASASRGPSAPTRSCASASRPRPRRFPGARALDLPLPGGVYPAFSREAADVHGELFRAHRDALRRERRDEARARAAR